MDAPIHIVVGNPPYSVGQKSANDDNQNLKYATLDKRVAETYAGKSTATNKNSLYDSYLRAFRWATDRIGERGIVSFVTNNGWIDGNTADGVRLSFAEEFTDIYVFNLRGNSHGGGETAKKEGGNVFDIRVGVQILVGIKDPLSTKPCHIHYSSVADYLKAAEKLEIINQSAPSTMDWTTIQPNQYGDWINQRNADFETWPVLGDKKATGEIRFFTTFSAGLKSGRDPWCYDFSRVGLEANMRELVGCYNTVRREFNTWAEQQGLTRRSDADVTRFLRDYDGEAARRISWNRSLKQQCARGKDIQFTEIALRPSTYRPFTAQRAYFDRRVNDMVYQLPSMFPTPKHDNIGIVSMAPRPGKEFAVLATGLIPDLSLFTYTGQFFPRWTWEPVEDPEGELDLLGSLPTAPAGAAAGAEGEVLDGYRRVDNITDAILAEYQAALGSDITKDSIFYFVYGQLHDPGYRAAYVADLKKMLPHIQTPTSRDRFDQLSLAGRRLLDLHVNYETVEPYPLEFDFKGGADPASRETWRVVKMAFAKKRDTETKKLVPDTTAIVYNKQLTIRGIPESAELYQLGSRSALAWIIDRYQVKKDKASGIVNDPNDWADEVDNPRYIADLIAKVTRVAVETVEIVESLQEGA